jgi:hypothetical protein
MTSKFADAYLRNIVRTYRTYKEMAERAIEQVRSEEDLNRELDESSNSIAIIVKHMRSDQRTRWPFQDRPFGDVIAWVNVELTKNAAEIGYARFLYAATGE